MSDLQIKISELQTLCTKYPNDMELGAKVRKTTPIENYKYQPNDIELGRGTRLLIPILILLSKNKK